MSDPSGNAKQVQSIDKDNLTRKSSHRKLWDGSSFNWRGELDASGALNTNKGSKTWLSKVVIAHQIEHCTTDSIQAVSWKPYIFILWHTQLIPQKSNRIKCQVGNSGTKRKKKPCFPPHTEEMQQRIKILYECIVALTWKSYFWGQSRNEFISIQLLVTETIKKMLPINIK